MYQSAPDLQKKCGSRNGRPSDRTPKRRESQGISRVCNLRCRYSNTRTTIVQCYKNIGQSFLVLVDLNRVKEVWLNMYRPLDVLKIANHYGIFRDLFGDAYFSPVLPLKINYKISDDSSIGVYTGNVIKPNEARELPTIEYVAPSDTLWTLIMSTPDGNMQNSNNEYCHWFL